MDYIPIPEFISQIINQNGMEQWLTALITAVVVAVFLIIIRSLGIKRFSRFAEKTANRVDDVLAEMLSKTRLLFVIFIAVWSGAQALNLPESIDSLLSGILIVFVLIQAGLWLNGMIIYLVGHFVRHEIEDESSRIATTTAITFVGKLVLWSVIFLLALDNLGVDINALIASLGVGGIAIALASQNILADLFASLSIMFDKPFVVGDFIVLADLAGTVENIGLKTTRVRSLSGEQLVISNQDLLSSRIKNFKRMQERRVVFNVGVTYQTKADLLEKIPVWIKEAVETQENARFDRSHFKAFGDFALLFETVFWVTQPDYALFMEIQQKINLALYQKFEKEGVEFAYPTQTVYVTGNS
jgi:small-conductance mechanosensitive channel